MLKGKRALITGASQGLGKVIAEKFIEQGADICISARNIDILQKTARGLSSHKVQETQKIVYLKADMGMTNDIDRLYEYAIDELGGVDCVVNNAGIQGPIGACDEVDWEDLERVIAINLMGTLFSMRKAIAAFKKQKSGGRIVNLSGGGAVGPRPNFIGYAVSKAAVVRATENMAVECLKDGIYINAVAPGALNTRMLDEVLDAGADAVGKAAYEKAVEQRETGGSSLWQAAELIAYLASDESHQITGKLISAVWDGWEQFKEHEEEIINSDVFTVRRIIPGDRGYHWKDNDK